MTVFGSSGAGFMAGNKQVFPIDYGAEVSQRLVDAAHGGDVKGASECVGDPFVDVNFNGTVSLKSRRTELVLRDESAHEVRVEHEEFRTEVTALFLAAHAGDMALVNKLLSVGADVNQKLFRGYATTAAVREGHLEILETLIKAGASQQACEEALLEASYQGRARLAKVLMGSDLIRHHVAVHGLVSACCRGFFDVVDALIKCGVNANAVDRVLLQSTKPSLHSNVDCNALAAAVVSRQISVVRLLLQGGVRTDIKVRLGAWSWDMDTGEEFRVGAGLAEAYPITWCAVEYYEASGTILRMLLHHLSPNTLHSGRSLLHHAILCNNARAVQVLLNSGADRECPVHTNSKTELRPIHLAARLGFASVVQSLVDGNCNVDSRTESGDTALMICARYKHVECIGILASAGADFGLVNSAGQSVSSIAGAARWSRTFQKIVMDEIRSGKVPKSSNAAVFSSLLLVAKENNIELLKMLVGHPKINFNEQDEDGFSAAMVVAAGGHVEAFTLLLRAGADVKLQNKHGESAISLSEANPKTEGFKRVMLEYALEQGKSKNSSGFCALHHAARLGDFNLARKLTTNGYDVNSLDTNGYTPLMVAAKEGHGTLCGLLISWGARYDIETADHETALSLARKKGFKNDAERAILDEMARKLVLNGASVRKHTKGGKGSPHGKTLRMVAGVGILKWGKAGKRNVLCREAEVGPSAKFQWNRRRKLDVDAPGLFHVVTGKNKEVHFVCEGGVEMAELWVRGIRLVTRGAIFGNKVE